MTSSPQPSDALPLPVATQMKIDLVRALLAGGSASVFDPKAPWKAQTAPIAQPGRSTSADGGDGSQS